MTPRDRQRIRRALLLGAPTFAALLTFSIGLIEPGLVPAVLGKTVFAISALVNLLFAAGGAAAAGILSEGPVRDRVATAILGAVWGAVAYFLILGVIGTMTMRY